MSPTPEPRVTILIPVHGEAERIERCLDAVLAQDWPTDKLEIVLVDGSPGDGTAEVANRALAARPGVAVSVLPNPGGGRSANLNLGLAALTGELVCRVDARSALPPGYVRDCAALLADPAVAVVGGAQITVPSAEDPHALGIARGLNNRFAMGMAQYRRGGTSGATDTVYLGAFRAAQLRAVGGWDESLVVNEDFDLNQRMQRFGIVWFSDRLAVQYLPRSTLREIAQQYRGFGQWKVRYLRATRARPRPRQVVAIGAGPMIALVSVLALASPRRWLWAVAAAGLALAGEAAGRGDGPRSSAVRVRLWSLATCATVVLSWCAGAWRELLGTRGARA